MSIFRMGKIPIERYQALVPNLDTDEVIITSERIAHINNEPDHRGDFDAYGQEFIPQILANPSYILKDKKDPNTAILIKAFPSEAKTLHFCLVLHLHTPKDPPDHYNSIISFWYIRQSEYKRLERKANMNA